MTKLYDLRNSKGISRKELADACKISARTLEGYEQGRKNIDGAKIATLARLSMALECSISDILEDEETVELCRGTCL